MRLTAQFARSNAENPKLIKDEDYKIKWIDEEEKEPTKTEKEIAEAESVAIQKAAWAKRLSGFTVTKNERNRN